MVPQKREENPKKKPHLMTWHFYYSTELKLLLLFFLFLLLATSLLFLPLRFSTSHLRVCISPQPDNNTTTTPLVASVSAAVAVPHSPPPAQHENHSETLKRVFSTHGAAAYSFIKMGAYRGGMNTFAVIGLSSKPLHLYSNPTYQCRWIPSDDADVIISAVGYKILPDWGFGRVYTVVVVNCTFSEPVNSHNSGGNLVLLASTSGAGDRNLNVTDEIPALTENPGSLDPELFNSKPKYDYLYCGSSLYGDLSPQRIREWLAYHVRLFGPRSHFVFYDAGGVHEEVLEVLRPWMELGYVSVEDVREEERFDGYYHNQFMVVNDCLHRYRFSAKWMFFFDVDEYVYLPRKGSTVRSVVEGLGEYTQFTIEQVPMSSRLCLLEDYQKTNRKWGFEKLVYKDVKRGIRRDKKYAVQPRNVYATGVHMSQNIAGKTTHRTEKKIKYFHYHGTVAERRETCKKLINDTQIYVDKVPYVLDTSMRGITGAVKRFEHRMIGSRLQQTRE